MKRSPRILALAILLATNANGDAYSVRIHPKPNETFAHADYTLWIPENVSTVKRILLHQHGCGDAAQTAGQTATDDLHWRLLAERVDAALLGSSLWPVDSCQGWSDPSGGTSRAFVQALEELARASGHEALTRVPWIIWGHSGGGYWTQRMMAQFPGRFEAAIFQSAAYRRQDLRHRTPDSADLPSDVPILIHVGIDEKGHERFGAIYDDSVLFFSQLRRQNAPVTFVLDPASGHNCGNTRYFSIPWIEAVVNRDGFDPVEAKLTLAAESCWFPNKDVAKKWTRFITDGDVFDESPPREPPRVVGISANRQGIRVEWNAKPDWESGIMTFRVYRNGTLLPPYTAPTGDTEKRTTRFREPNYSDTPRRPLSQMEYLDTSELSPGVYEYQVSLVNWAGLESAKSASASIEIR